MVVARHVVRCALRVLCSSIDVILRYPGTRKIINRDTALLHAYSHYC